MPILPFDSPEPFAAILGVMLFPGTDKDDRLKARAFASQWLIGAIQRNYNGNQPLSHDDLFRIVMDAGELGDVDDRWWEATATGEMFKALWALSNTNPALATWNNAAKLAEIVAARDKNKGSRSLLWRARSRFLSVAHLWGAWCICEGKFETRPEVGYDGISECQSFLTEAEILRRWGQTWRPQRAKSKPLLPAYVWQIPETCEPPGRRNDWPETGKIPMLIVSADLLAELKPAGRPRKGG